MAELELSRSASALDVLVSRLTGVTRPPAPADYSAWEVDANILPVTVEHFHAPRTCRATLRLNIAKLNAMPWQWADYISKDDRIAVVQSEGRESGDGMVFFAGFVTEVDWSVAQSTGEVIIVAVSNAHRLARDVDRFVYGRRMLTKDGDLATFTGPKTKFNADGKPNRSESLFTEGIEVPARGLATFTGDNQDGATLWTWPDIAEYLMWLANPDETWLGNYTFLASVYSAETKPIEVDVTGLSLWAALAAAGNKAGWDVFELFYWDAEGELHVPASRIEMVERNSGDIVYVSHQDREADGSFARLDLNATNLFTTRVHDSVTNCTVRPIVLGAQELVEITVELGKAWDPADLTVPTGGIKIPGSEKRWAASDYVKKYCVGGSEYPEHSDAGRLWDANTDGRYSASPYSLDLCDVAAWAQDSSTLPASGSWPAMPYAPRPCLTREDKNSAGGTSTQCMVHISFDGGTTRQPLTDCQVDKDRLAVRITAANLASIMPASTKRSWSATENLFYKLVNDSANVKVYLTCCIAAPVRGVSVATRGIYAGTAFDTAEVIDRGAMGGVRRRAVTDYLTTNYTSLTVDDGDDSGDLDDIVLAAQLLNDRPQIEADLPLEWPDDSTIRLSRRIERIDGINYSFLTGDDRSPRIVAITYRLTPESWGMTITLGSLRPAPVL